MKFQSTYSNKRKVKLINNDKSLTHQSFKDETLISNILRKNRLIGIDLMQQNFDINKDNVIDVSEIPDFHTYQNKLAQAHQSFMQLDARLRAKFANDPQKLLSFLANPQNRDEAVKLGLVQQIQNENEIIETKKANKNSVLSNSVSATADKSASDI